MILVKVEDAVSCTDILSELVEREMNARTAYKVARLAREVDKEVKLYQDTQHQIAEKYVERNEDGSIKTDENGYWHVAQENVEKYSEELKGLLNEEIEINAERLSLNELIEEKFTPKQMNGLMAFIEE